MTWKKKDENEIDPQWIEMTVNLFRVYISLRGQREEKSRKAYVSWVENKYFYELRLISYEFQVIIYQEKINRFPNSSRNSETCPCQETPRRRSN